MALRTALPLAILVVAVSSSRSSAGVIVYDNGPSANDNGFNFLNPSSADDFVLSANTVVDGVRFWAFSDTVADLSTIGWAVMSDGGGHPGAVLFSGLSPSSVVDTGNQVTLNPLLEIYDVHFSIAPVSLLGGTTYWLALDAGTIFGFDYLDLNGWLWTTGVTGNPSMAGGPSSWTTAGFDRDNAFQLEGSQVSEPATLLLVGSGLLAVARRRRSS